MNECSPFLPQGINENCVMDLKEIRNIIVTTADASFTSVYDAQSLSSWKAKVNQSLTCYVPLGLNDYDTTTGEPNIVTFDSGRKAITKKPVPSHVFRLMSNFCDYKELMAAFRGGTFRMFFVDFNGNVYGTRTNVGVIKGFACTLNAITQGGPLKDVAKNFSVWANFLSYDEFEAGVLLPMSFNITSELTDASPVGLYLAATGAYDTSAGTITVQISKRCSDGFAGLVAADFTVIESNNLVSPTVSAITDSGNGAYTLTIHAGASPAALVAGNYVSIQVKKTVSSVVTYASGRLAVNV